MIGNKTKTVWRTVGTAVALAALCLSATGCIEELHQGGGKVSFTASTSYLNGGVKGETKTIYSGQFGVSSGSRFEHIYWETGDLITIRCDQASGPNQASGPKVAVYKVTAESTPAGGSNTAKKIEATPPDSELYWDMSGGKHHFFAAYPSSVTFTDRGETDLLVMEHSVPGTQTVTKKQTKTTGANNVDEYVPNMGLVAMGAYSGKNPELPNPAVDLNFIPLVTTLRVELLAGDALSKNNKLTMLQLKSSASAAPLAGSFQVAVGDYNNHKTGVFAGDTDVYGSTGFKLYGSPSATENAVRIVPDGTVFPTGGIKLSTKDTTAFTFVMLPVAGMELTLELTFGGTYDAATQTVTGGTTRSLELKTTQSGTTAWWSPPAFRKSYLRQVGVQKKQFKVNETEATGISVTDGGTISYSSLYPYDSYFQVRTTLGGYTTTITKTDDLHDGKAKFDNQRVEATADMDYQEHLYVGWQPSAESHRYPSAVGNTTTIGIISGTFTPQAFTVSASNKKVYFSPGNLRYNRATSTCGFHVHQYDVIGDGYSNTGGQLSGWMDLFGWATSGWDGGSTYARTSYPFSSWTPDPNDYRPQGITDGADLSLVGANAHGDWGVHNSPIEGESWRLLTGAEMEYLFKTRANSYIRAYLSPKEPSFTVTFTAIDDPNYAVSFTIEKPKVKGIILFPDGFNTDLIASSIRDKIDNATADYQKIDNWKELEDAGCVFLPYSPSRIGDVPVTTQTGNTASYYTSTAKADLDERVESTRLEFGLSLVGSTPVGYTRVESKGIGIAYGADRVAGGYCVRLVRDVPATPTGLGYTTTGNAATFIGDSYGAYIRIDRITYSDGTYKENPDNVTWSTDSPDHLTLSSTTGNDIVATPKATAPGAKLAKVIAECEGVQREVYVYIHKIESVTVTTADPIIYVGGTTLATPTITWTEVLATGLTQTRQATVNNITGNWIVTPETGRVGGWKSSNPSVATVSDSGRVRGVSSPATGNTAEISYSIRHNNRSENYSNVATGSVTVTVKTTGDPEAYNVTGNNGIQ